MTLTTKSGQAVAPLFYGTAWKKAATTSLVALALKTGFRAIDTACQPKHYREDLVGEALAKTYPTIPREDLFIQTKFTQKGGQDPYNIPYDKNASPEEQCRQSFAKSLQNLQTDYLDAVLLHSPARTVDDTVSLFNVLNDFKSKDKVRYLGISNIYALSKLQEIIARVPKSTIQIIQNRFYRDTGYDVDIRKYCKEHGIIYQSFWTLSANSLVTHRRSVHDIAKRMGTTPECVFYRFCVQEGITVLDGTTSEEHMKQDLEVVTEDRFALTEEEKDSIRGTLWS
jgi:diketogulonate reductase-like aldo/keto reductase